MKQERLITECPACKARFQVTSGQLKIAHGKVRCGTCLEVFNAQLCKIPEPKPQHTALQQTVPQHSAPQERPATKLSTDTAQNLSQTIQPKRPAIPKAFIPAKTPAVTEQPQTKQTPAIDLDKPVQALFTDTATQETITKRTVARKPISQISSDTYTLPAQQSVEEIQNQTLEQPVSLHIRHAKSAITRQPETQAKQSTTATSPATKTVQPAKPKNQQQTLATAIDEAHQINNDGQNEKIRLALHQHQTSYQVQTNDHGYLNPAEKKLQELLRNAGNPLTATETASHDEVAPSPDNLPHSSILALHPDTEDKDTNFIPQQTEPVMIRATTRYPSQTITFSFITLLALSTLLLQYMWFERNTLIQQPALAKLYKPVCEQIKCQLSVPQSVANIQTEQLIVQEHKDYQGVLKISMLLQNKAVFEQPFPAIELAFSDRSGEIVKRRTFQPAEYLNTTVFSPVSMPLENSIQVHFDILDPGRAAVGYEVNLHPSSLTNSQL
ncbi:DUF3426 domain-containing protein [Aliamphritea ceti]|uniref:DUF3426 domain-containing protein n=1 Tax=Aliamphritea ceti TaxID=1524258 RepID=UPI0021C3B742|nr:DUF3426 domain-containing protein [Aliamphritea ceti]